MAAPKRSKLAIILGLVAGLGVIGVIGVIAALLMVIVVLIGMGVGGWYFLQSHEEVATEWAEEVRVVEEVAAPVPMVEAPAEEEPAEDALADDTLADDALADDALADDALADDAALTEPVTEPVRDEPPAEARPKVTPSRSRPAARAPQDTTPQVGVPTQIKLLSSPPNATLVVDGEAYGVTPAKFEIPAGTHQVELQSAGETGRFSIRVSTSGNNKWCYDFEADAARHGSCL